MYIYDLWSRLAIVGMFAGTYTSNVIRNLIAGSHAQ